MEKADTYILPLDHGAVAARRQVFIIATVIQVVVAVGLPVLIAVLVGSFAIAVPLYLIMGIGLLVVLRKDPERWRGLRAITEYPPVFTREGLRLRAVSTSGYDLRVPWSQVSRIVSKPRGRRWNLYVHIEDAERLAGDDPVKGAALRKMQGPPGAPVSYAIGYVVADLQEMNEEVRRLSDGRLSVERGT